MSGREEILARVRAALADVPAQEPPARPDPVGGTPAAPNELANLFAERCGDYQANVTRCGGAADAIRTAIAQACARHHVHQLVVPDGLPPGWLPPAIIVRTDDPPLTPTELDDTDGVLTTCAAAIALTGTIILDAGPGQGRRALTLVPDLHICLVPADRILHGVPEALAAVCGARPLTLISGPSATSDIELQRVEGVHGPRRLEVIVAQTPSRP